MLALLAAFNISSIHFFFFFATTKFNEAHVSNCICWIKLLPHYHTHKCFNSHTYMRAHKSTFVNMYACCWKQKLCCKAKSFIENASAAQNRQRWAHVKAEVSMASKRNLVFFKCNNRSNHTLTVKAKNKMPHLCYADIGKINCDSFKPKKLFNKCHSVQKVFELCKLPARA